MGVTFNPHAPGPYEWRSPDDGSKTKSDSRSTGTATSMDGATLFGTLGANNVHMDPELRAKVEADPNKQHNFRIVKYTDTMPVLRPLTSLTIGLIGAFAGADGMADVIDSHQKDWNRIGDMVRKHGMPDDWNLFGGHYYDYVVSELPPPTPDAATPPEEKKEEIDAKIIEKGVLVPPLPRPGHVSTRDYPFEDCPTLDVSGMSKKQFKSGKPPVDSKGQVIPGGMMTPANKKSLATDAAVIAGLPDPPDGHHITILVHDSPSASAAYNYGLTGSREVSERVELAKEAYAAKVKALMQGGMPEAEAKKAALEWTDRTFGLTELGKTLGVTPSEGRTSVVEELAVKGMDAHIGGNDKIKVKRDDITLRDLCFNHAGLHPDPAKRAAIDVVGMAYDGTGDFLRKANTAANAAGIVQIEDTNRMGSAPGSVNQSITPGRGSRLMISQDFSWSGFGGEKGALGIAKGLAARPDATVDDKRAARGLAGGYLAAAVGAKTGLVAERGLLLVDTNHIIDKFPGVASNPSEHLHAGRELAEMVGPHNAYLLMSGKDPADTSAGWKPPLPPGVHQVKMPPGAKHCLPAGVAPNLGGAAGGEALVATFAAKGLAGDAIRPDGRIGAIDGRIAKLDGEIKVHQAEIDALPALPAGTTPMSFEDATAHLYARALGDVETNVGHDAGIMAEVGPGGKKKLSEKGLTALNGNVTGYRQTVEGMEAWAKANPEAVARLDAARPPGTPTFMERIAKLKGNGEGSIGALESRLTAYPAHAEAVEAGATIGAGKKVAAKATARLDGTAPPPRTSETALSEAKAAEKAGDHQKAAKLYAEAGDLAREEAGVLMGDGEIDKAIAKYKSASGLYHQAAGQALAAKPPDLKQYNSAVEKSFSLADEMRGHARTYADAIVKKTGAGWSGGVSATGHETRFYEGFMGLSSDSMAGIPSRSGMPMVTHGGVQAIGLKVRELEGEKTKLQAEIASRRAKDPNDPEIAKLEKRVGELDAKIKDLRADLKTAARMQTENYGNIRAHDGLMQGIEQSNLQGFANMMSNISDKLLQMAGRQGTTPIDIGRIGGVYRGLLDAPMIPMKDPNTGQKVPISLNGMLQMAQAKGGPPPVPPAAEPGETKEQMESRKAAEDSFNTYYGLPPEVPAAVPVAAPVASGT